MLNSSKFATAASIVFIIYSIVLILITALIPDLALLAPGNMPSGGNDINWGYLIIGLIIAAAIVWILVFATIWIYNKLL